MTLVDRLSVTEFTKQPTRQQVAEHSVGQILNLNELCSMRLINSVCCHDLRACGDFEGTN
jgi:hypothetical protein